MDLREQAKQLAGATLGLLSFLLVFYSLGIGDIIATGHYFAKLQVKLETTLSRSANIRLIAQDSKYEDFFSRLPNELRRFIETTSLIQKDKLFEAKKIIDVPSIKFQDVNSKMLDAVDNLLSKQLEIDNVTKELKSLNTKRSDLDIDEIRIKKERRQLNIGVIGNKDWRQARNADLDVEEKTIKEERKKILPRKKELKDVLKVLTDEKSVIKRQATSAANIEIISMIVSTLDDEKKQEYNKMALRIREIGIDLPIIQGERTKGKNKVNFIYKKES
jgi:hypothetical protein